jgi:hypothetical protein
MAETTFDTAIERELQHRYHQPRRSSNSASRRSRSRAERSSGTTCSASSSILWSAPRRSCGGLGVAAGLLFQASVAAECSGIVVAAFIYVVMATVGIDYGIPGQVATRAIYGLRGSKVIPSFLRSIASCYWFAFQTDRRHRNLSRARKAHRNVVLADPGQRAVGSCKPSGRSSGMTR